VVVKYNASFTCGNEEEDDDDNDVDDDDKVR